MLHVSVRNAGAVCLRHCCSLPPGFIGGPTILCHNLFLCRWAFSRDRLSQWVRNATDAPRVHLNSRAQYAYHTDGPLQDTHTPYKAQGLNNLGEYWAIGAHRTIRHWCHRGRLRPFGGPLVCTTTVYSNLRGLYKTRRPPFRSLAWTIAIQAKHAIKCPGLYHTDELN